MSQPDPTSMKPHRLRLLAAALIALGAAIVAGLLWETPTQPEEVAQVWTTPPANPESPVITTAPTIHRILESTGAEDAESPLPLNAALDLEGDVPFAERLAYIHSLPDRIPLHVSESLAAFVADPREPTSLTRSQLLALRNDVLNVLRQQEDFRESLQELLQELAADPARDITLRDYALQHLAAQIIDHSPSAADDGNSAQWASHRTAIRGEDDSLAATAMLHFLSAARRGTLSSEDQSELAAAALRLAFNESTHPHSRATAFQVCGRLSITEARDPALTIAASDDQSFPLRIAAIATLGDLGPTPAVLNLLRELEFGPEIRLRVPATSSLHRLTAQ